MLTFYRAFFLACYFLVAVRDHACPAAPRARNEVPAFNAQAGGQVRDGRRTRRRGGGGEEEDEEEEEEETKREP